MTLALKYAARSDRGLIRPNNQDSVYAGPRLLAVADGMGGHAGGDIASKIVIAALEPLDEDSPKDDLLAEFREAIYGANEHLREVIETNPELSGMGTTLTSILFSGNRITLAHVGDSRCYLLRGSQFTQITHDDTVVQALVDEGQLTVEEASSHPQRSLILRALNGTDVEPDISVREARVGDRYLLCSDGLSSVVSADTLLEALEIADPEACADQLIELALRGGGPDNVTCIVADVIDVEYGDDTVVVDGAAGGNRSQRSVAPTSPAARAALASQANQPQPAPEPSISPPRRRRRQLIIAGIVGVLLIGGFFSFWKWTQTQYFVATNKGQVAVYRGVNASLGPIKLHSVAENSDLKLKDLQQAARDQVRNGIDARNRADANQIIKRLFDQQLRPCSDPDKAAPSPHPSPSGSPTAPPTSPAPKTSTAPSPAPVSPAVAPERELIPGQDCRVVS